MTSEAEGSWEACVLLFHFGLHTLVLFYSSEKHVSQCNDNRLSQVYIFVCEGTSLHVLLSGTLLKPGV